jgi:hypothetical protein
MTNEPTTYRQRALASEERARLTLDPAIKTAWEELAIEWHLLAHVTEPAAELAEIDLE